MIYMFFICFRTWLFHFAPDLMQIDLNQITLASNADFGCGHCQALIPRCVVQKRSKDKLPNQPLKK